IGQSDIETAQRYLNEFAQLIRIVLYNSRQQTVRLQDEIEALRRYLNLEQFRFHPTFRYTIDIDPQIQIDFVEIPPMIFQPFVENAIWHGLMHKESTDRKLHLSFTKKQRLIRIEIEDNSFDAFYPNASKLDQLPSINPLGCK
ncbi:MAG: histidine kinase, partial [Bacteroidota bacterium]